MEGNGIEKEKKQRRGHQPENSNKEGARMEEVRPVERILVVIGSLLSGEESGPPHVPVTIMCH